MPASTTFPAEFADLEPFAAFARFEEAIAYLDRFPLDSLPDDAQNLMWLYCALVTVSFPIEVWRQPRVPDSGASSFDEISAPAF